jgi:hypothetical protein
MWKGAAGKEGKALKGKEKAPHLTRYCTSYSGLAHLPGGHSWVCQVATSSAKAAPGDVQQLGGAAQSEEGRAHHSNELFITTFLANFQERRLGEVRGITLPRTPLNKPWDR